MPHVMKRFSHARIQEYSSGGGGGPVFFSPQLILQKSNGYFQRKLSFPKVPEGVHHFLGGGGSNCLFPIETHITCDFQGGGSGPPVPPLDLPMFHLEKKKLHQLQQQKQYLKLKL